MITFSASQIAQARANAALFHLPVTHRALGRLLDEVNADAAQSTIPFSFKTVTRPNTKAVRRLANFVSLYGDKLPLEVWSHEA